MRDTLVVGGGVWGARVAWKLRELGERVRVVEENPDRNRAMHEAWVGERGFPMALSLAGYLEVTGADRAVVCVPPARQLEVVRMLADAGVAQIRVEKPCGVDAEQAAEMARSPGVTVGYQMLAHPAWRIAREWIASTGGVVDAWRLSKGQPRHPVSALLDLGSHAAAYMASAGATGTIRAGFGLDDRRVLRATSGDGVLTLAENQRGVDVDIDGVNLYLELESVDVLAVSLREWLGGDGVSADLAVAAHEILRVDGVEL